MVFPRITLPAISRSLLIIISAALLTLLYNQTYFQHLVSIYPLNAENAVFLASLPLLQFFLCVLLLSLLRVGFLFKPALALMFILSALAAYFMDSYDTVIDADMLQNVAQTNIEESMDLFSWTLVGYVFVLGLLPVFLIIITPLKTTGISRELFSMLKLLATSVLGIILIIFLLYKPYASFFREHKPLRAYSNPLYWVYSTARFVQAQTDANPGEITPVGKDAHIVQLHPDRELIILVVGETARADHFSLNGYPRETNPLLKQEKLVNFTQVSACGTSTAISVPCMFSVLNQSDFSYSEARQRENLLDVLTRAGVFVLWRDNNSSSKGVADRVTYENYRDPANNPVCDVECRDEGMLVGLQQVIDSHPAGDIFIVLHQMGNHGPAYYKRYPENFEVFTPTCRSAELKQCTEQEINNAYDNALRYTDYFLSKTIQLLKQNSTHFETAMLYVSDHGESLGENGLYLHGLPDFIAPDSQTHVPALLWIGDSYLDIDHQAIQRKADLPLSHDHLFHTLLGLFEINSEVHEESLDILSDSW